MVGILGIGWPLKELKHEVVGHWVGRFALVQASIATLHREIGFVLHLRVSHNFSLVLHHGTLGRYGIGCVVKKALILDVRVGR